MRVRLSVQVFARVYSVASAMALHNMRIVLNKVHGKLLDPRICCQLAEVGIFHRKIGRYNQRMRTYAEERMVKHGAQDV